LDRGREMKTVELLKREAMALLNALNSYSDEGPSEDTVSQAPTIEVINHWKRLSDWWINGVSEDSK